MKFFPFAAVIVFRVRCIACASAEKMELNFGSDVESVRFLVVAAALTSISLFESSVYMCFHLLYLISKIFSNLLEDTK